LKSQYFLIKNRIYAREVEQEIAYDYIYNITNLDFINRQIDKKTAFNEIRINSKHVLTKGINTNALLFISSNI